jgi:hypothetical protein
MVQQVFGKSGNQEYQFDQNWSKLFNLRVSHPILGCSLTKTKQAVHQKPGVAPKAEPLPKSRSAQSLCKLAHTTRHLSDRVPYHQRLICGRGSKLGTQHCFNLTFINDQNLRFHRSRTMTHPHVLNRTTADWESLASPLQTCTPYHLKVRQRKDWNFLIDS